MTDPRYPVGQFDFQADYTDEQREQHVRQIEEAPARLREAVAGLNDAQLDTPYREGGWTLRQVVHHLADSHLNGYVRMKLALTEDVPAIKTYDEARWAELGDAARAPVAVSLALFEALHGRLAASLRALAPGDFGRTFSHPEWGTVPVRKLVAIYAWHGRHHTAHITTLRERMGW